MLKVSIYRVFASEDLDVALKPVSISVSNLLSLSNFCLESLAVEFVHLSPEALDVSLFSRNLAIVPFSNLHRPRLINMVALKL